MLNDHRAHAVLNDHRIPGAGGTKAAGVSVCWGLAYSQPAP
jgi:hypothetical protein